MDLIFVFLTQLVNHSSFELGFEVDGNRGLLPKLRKGKTRYARRIRKSDPGWKIRVLIDGEFSGIELDPEVLLKFVRVVFSIEEKDEGGLKWKALCVHGALENHTTDFLFRHRCFGCMRDRSWNSRKLEFIRRSDWSLAAESRSTASPQNESPTVPIIQETERPPVQIRQARAMGHPHPPGAPQRSEDQTGTSNVRPLGHPLRFRKQKRPNAQARSRDDESSADPPKPSRQQARVRDDESLTTTKPAKPSRRRRSDMAATREQARRRDNEYNSLVLVLLFCFALTVFLVLKKFNFLLTYSLHGDV